MIHSSLIQRRSEVTLDLSRIHGAVAGVTHLPPRPIARSPSGRRAIGHGQRALTVHNDPWIQRAENFVGRSFARLRARRSQP